jgi:CrcB protein
VLAREVATVAVGGAVGVACREAIILVVPSLGGIPVAILIVNVIGAFLLGLLVEALAQRGPDAGARRSARLLLGTGLLGGFTTYSALAADGALLLGADPASGALYALGTLVLGAIAAFLGIALGSVVRPPRSAGSR